MSVRPCRLPLMGGRRSRWRPWGLGDSMRRVLTATLVASLALSVLSGCAAKPAAETQRAEPVSVSTPSVDAASSESSPPVAPRAAPQPVAVPITKGKVEGQARRLLREAGFRVKVARRTDAKVKKGVVISQKPSKGTAQPGARVVITVSTGVPAPSTAEISTAFRRRYAKSLYGSPRLKVRWKGRDRHGVWWAAVVIQVMPGEAYASCGYRKAPGRWVIQDIGRPDGSVSRKMSPTPPAEVVSAMKRQGVSVLDF